MIEKRRMVRCANNAAYKINLNAHTVFSTNFRQAEVIDEFATRTIKGSRCGHDVKVYCDPIIMLFNQQRLEKQVGADVVEAWIKSMSAHQNSALASLKAKCSDDDLISLVKSRHLQAPCEIQAWAELMNANMKHFNEELSKLAAEKAEAEKRAADEEAKRNAEINA